MRFRKTIITLVSLLALLALYLGIRLRPEIWSQTQDIRFIKDVTNAYLWGRNARGVGLFNLYDRVAAGNSFRSEVDLDYTPLRLMAATAWQAWTQRHFPDAKGWQPDYAFTARMLWANTIAAMLAAILVFLLIRMWIIRMDDANRPPGVSPRMLRGIAPAMFGALLLWFNPALLWNGYAWVQWDVWLVPFFLAAVYLACLDWWFAAGVCLAIGASLKGQLLIAAPVMILWPIFQFRFGAVLRIIAGLMLTTMLIALPFLNATTIAFIWYVLMLVAMGLVAPITLRWKIDYRWLLGAALAAVVLAWPWMSSAPLAVRLLPAATLAIVALSRFLPPRLIPHVYALAIAGAILLIMPLFNAGTAWFTQGFEYGPNRDQSMHGLGTNNLPNILQTYLHWPNTAHHKVWAPFLGDVEMKMLMAIIYGIFLLLCGLGAAIQYKRKDTRFLIAIFLPWLLFFLLLTQIRGRYLVWAAAISALLAADSVGMALLGLIVTTVSALEMIENQYLLNEQYYGKSLPPWVNNLTAMEPHLGWLLLLIAAISLYFILVPRRRAEIHFNDGGSK